MTMGPKCICLLPVSEPVSDCPVHGDKKLWARQECSCERNAGGLILKKVPTCILHGIRPASQKAREKLTEQEAVNHPQHYGGDTTYEAIKVIEAWGLGFHLGNAIKYVCRAGKKSTMLEDLKKARWYLDRAITNLETQE